MSKIAYPVASETQQRQRTATASEASSRGRDRSLDRLRSNASQHRHSHTPATAALDAGSSGRKDTGASVSPSPSSTLGRTATFAQMPVTDAEFRLDSTASNATTDDGFLTERWRHRRTTLKVKVMIVNPMRFAWRAS